MLHAREARSAYKMLAGKNKKTILRELFGNA
jgi:hypothetical protein